MEKFKIEITETLSRVVEIKAKTFEEALATVEASYYNEEIVLDYTNYANLDFKRI